MAPVTAVRACCSVMSSIVVPPLLCVVCGREAIDGRRDLSTTTAVLALTG
jgi:hypothetical protein